MWPRRWAITALGPVVVMMQANQALRTLAVLLFLATPAAAGLTPGQACENVHDELARLTPASAYNPCPVLDQGDVPMPECIVLSATFAAAVDPWTAVCDALEDTGPIVDDLTSPDCLRVASNRAAVIDPWPQACEAIELVVETVLGAEVPDCLALTVTEQRAADSSVACLLIAVIRETVLAGGCQDVMTNAQSCVDEVMALVLDEVPTPGGTLSRFCYSAGGQDVMCAWSGNYATILPDDACSTAPGPGEHCYEFGSSNGGGALGAGAAQGTGIHRPTLCNFSGSITTWDECTDSESLFTEGGLVHPETYGAPNSCHVTESKAAAAPWPPAEAVHESCW